MLFKCTQKSIEIQEISCFSIHFFVYLTMKKNNIKNIERLYVTPNQAADIIGVSRRRIYAMMKAKSIKRRLPASFIMNRWLILRKDAEIFAAKDRPPGNPYTDN